jgi:hypothetical protein
VCHIFFLHPIWPVYYHWLSSIDYHSIFFNQLANKTIYSMYLVFKWTSLIHSGRKLKLDKFKYTSAYCFKMNLTVLSEMSPKNQVLCSLILCQWVNTSQHFVVPSSSGPNHWRGLQYLKCQELLTKWHNITSRRIDFSVELLWETQSHKMLLLSKKLSLHYQTAKTLQSSETFM